MDNNRRKTPLRRVWFLGAQFLNKPQKREVSMSMYPLQITRIKAPKDDACTFEELRLRILPSQLVISSSLNLQNAHRMNILREAYRYVAVHAKYLLIGDKLIQICYDDNSLYSTACASEDMGDYGPEIYNPFLPIMLAILYDESQSSYRIAHLFADALWFLAYQTVDKLGEFFSSQVLTLCTLKKLGALGEAGVCWKNKLSELGLDPNEMHSIPLEKCRHFFLQRIPN